MNRTPSNRSIAYIGIGSNLGDRLGYLRNAVKSIKQLGDSIAVSGVYETEPVGVDDDQPMYLNMVMAMKTNLSPSDLLRGLSRIERAHGRVRTQPNAARTLDLDLLMIDDRVIEMPDLIVPHPRMHQRAFVMLPFAEIAPGVQHPILKSTIIEIAQPLHNQKVCRIGAIDDTA